MIDRQIERLTEIAAEAPLLRLFLDYDGTLAEFSPTPDFIQPRDDLMLLAEKLVSSPGMLPAVISGRRLKDVQQLLPAAGLLLAGTYGIEMRLPDGSLRCTVPLADVRPRVAEVKVRWEKITAGLDGFILEDKGWTVALHGRFARPDDLMKLEDARLAAGELLAGAPYRLLGGDRFLEFAPLQASKSAAVKWILDELTPRGAEVIYLGDDDKDEEAFKVVMEAGGRALRVAAGKVESCAAYRLPGPPQVRAWLEQVLAARK